jgi:hypothetical protein
MTSSMPTSAATARAVVALCGQAIYTPGVYGNKQECG